MAKINKAPLFVRAGNVLTTTLLRAGVSHPVFVLEQK
jgi:hypothetical protein